MYDNEGYFCCEKGQVGYNLGNTDGCIESGKSLPDGAYPLAVVDQISISTSTSALASATALTTTKTTNHSPTSSPNTNNTAAPGGAIAGGVVGGVAGVAIIAGLFWFLRKKKGSTNLSASNIPLSGHGYKDESSRYAGYSEAPILSRAEMDGSPHATELSTNTDMTQGRSEMP
ncbi:hypothetical protein ANO14919_094790 [Xylariales sp. No.14919]|nr:hypothetical protein ANO14919_094790 [Xylariales sp. No.14919]